LTSLFNDSKFQSVATEYRCDIHEEWTRENRLMATKKKAAKKAKKKKH
jgi:hypothetical protein